jgi:ABC-type dipeptide/oligopeptide/nickel transport system permease subunit
MRWREKLQRSKNNFIKNWRIYKRNRLGVIGLAIITFFIILAIFADFIAPYDPMNVRESWLVGAPFAKPTWIRFFDPTIPPESTFGLLGCDELGRDILSQVIYGARISLFISLCSAIVVIGIGLVVGILAGYYGGKIDMVLMRITDVMLVLPFLPLLIVLTAIIGSNMINMVILLGILGWSFTARLVRSQVLKEKERAYIEAAKAVGAKDGYIMRRHILPNVSPLLFANTVTLASMFIMLEAGLSFIGLGDPAHISWGMMLHYAIQNRAMLLGAWWYVIPPGLCITLVVPSLIFIGQALDDVLNPRLRRRKKAP